jgi:F-type H+-transporting ATPase subunit delta
MDLSKISVRYAKALYLLGKEKNLLLQIRNDIVLIHETMKAIPDFRSVIESPVIKPSEKIKAVNGIFKGRVQVITMNFLNILIKNKRENSLEGVCRNYIDIYSRELGIKTAVITTVVPVDDTIKKMVTELLAREFKAKIEIETRLNPEILGGYVLKVGDQQYDASVANSLRKIKQALVKSDFSKN